MDSNDLIEQNLREMEKWGKDIFYFTDSNLNMRPSEPLESLRGKVFKYKDGFGVERTTVLFDNDGNLVFPDLSIYKKEMFKHQDPGAFKKYHGTRFTWQQTVFLEAYNRAIATFDKDSFDISKRFITVRAGHGVGKTAALSVIAQHFLFSFMGSQVGATANTEDQLKDIFLKEFYLWSKKLPDYLSANLEQMDDFVRVAGEKDWFLRARVSRKEKPEALAGLHAEYVLILVDEASGIADQIFEVMKGALTGENFVVIYISNPTRTTGEFFESHKKGSEYTKLHFSSRQSPIVKPGYIEKMESDYPSTGEQHSNKVLIRVDGEFPSTLEMNDKGWIPLFANVTIRFEPERGQIIKQPIVSVDPAGMGRDSTSCGVRDNIYLKEVFNEKVSEPKLVARKVETVRDSYGSNSNDIAIDGFGIGAQVAVEVQTKTGEHVNAILMDKPREETKDRFKNYKAELCWSFREWVVRGGIIITNRQKEWLKEMEKIMYRRDAQGRIEIQSKVEFKKEHGFSPDRFDMATMTFFKDEPTRPVIISTADKEAIENLKWLQNAKQSTEGGDSFSSM